MPSKFATADSTAEHAVGTRIRSAIDAIHHSLLNERNKHLLVSSSLNSVIRATESRCGALAEVVTHNANNSVLRICSIINSNQALHPDPKFIDLFATAEVFGTRFLEGQNAIGDFFELKPLLPILTGSVQHDSPFLAVPFMNKHSLTGVVVLAGRKNGYPTDWQRSAATLFSSLHVALMHYQSLRQQFIEKRSLNRAQNLLLNTLRHEIRTPINGILGLCDLIRDTDPTAQQEHFVHAITDSASKLLSTVNDALEHPKLSASRIEVYEQMFDLMQLAEDLITMLDRARADKGITIELKFPPDMQRHYFGDAAKIRHVLTNLVCNAIKYTDHGGVTIELCKNSAQEIEISVRDTGVGMGPEQLLEIFQMNNPTKGLGFLINRTLARQMGGDIEIKSAREIGSVFTLRLPLKSPNAPIDPDQSLFHPQQFPERRILLVEDDPINQNITVFALSRLGCHVDVAADGHEALQMYKTKYYDLILMDCRMPKMDGYASTRKIRELEALHGAKRVPIVAVTANDLPENRDKCLEVGMDDYLPKPVQLSVMRNVVQMYLNRKSNPPGGVDEISSMPQDPKGQLHKPNLGILFDMLGDDCSLIQRVLKRYKAVLTEQREFLEVKGQLLNKKEFSKYIEMMKGGAAYSGYNNFAAYLAGLESGINNGSVSPNAQIVNELIAIIDRVINDTTPLLLLKKPEVV